MLRSLEVRGFRNLEPARIALGAEVTVVHGPNGAGKTNLLEATAFALTGRSPRTAADRELIAFGDEFASSEVAAMTAAGERRWATAISRDGQKRIRVDGVDSPSRPGVGRRPAVNVFMPDRLELVKGPPGERRARLDGLAATRWPARSGTRRRFASALAQRNALLSRIRAGTGSTSALGAWDRELAEASSDLRDLRRAATEELAGPFAAAATDLGLAGMSIEYRPRIGEADVDTVERELAERRQADLERGHTGHGPHRDELAVLRDGRLLRSYGSQGEQRTAVLALLLAERDVLAAMLPEPPVMLLDDVMSELDATRRRMLRDRLSGGQSVVTATEAEHVPGPADVILRVTAGRVEEES